MSIGCARALGAAPAAGVAVGVASALAVGTVLAICGLAFCGAVPGIGRFYVESIGQRDYSLLMALTVLYAFAVAAVNVAVDVSYAYIDPRVRYS